MYIYFFITLFIIISIYLVKSKQVESLVSSVVDVTDPNALEKKDLALNKENNQKNNEIFNKRVYLTDNKINYNFLDNQIDLLIRQYNNIEYNYKNFTLNTASVVTSTNPNSKPNIIIGGSFPSNIQLSFEFPPPLPGITGAEGEEGDKGPPGKKGETGKQGMPGPFGSCPK